LEASLPRERRPALLDAPAAQDKNGEILPISRCVIATEAPTDGPAIEALLGAAFGPGRFAKTSDRVREVAVHDPALSKIARSGETLIGCCKLYRIRIGATPALFLGPLAVDPAIQGEGVGRAMLREALAAADDAGPWPVLLVGQPGYFAPFGFVRMALDRVRLPGIVEQRRLLWRLPPGAAEPEGTVSAPRDAS
jgi:predicted N-acetyltransferase YhbS